MKKNILKAGLSLIVFNYLPIVIILLLMAVFNMNFSDGDYFSLSVLNCVASCAIAIAILVINYNLIKEGIKKARETYKTSVVLKFLKNAFIVLVILYLVRFVGGYISELLATLFNLESTTIDNQTSIESLLGSAPAMMIISACIFAPISEELIFRGSFREAIKNKRVYITVSGLTFGLSHITDNLLFILEILIIGIVISYIMNKSDYNKNKKIMLSVICMLSILLLGSVIYYMEFGNLITKIMSLDIKEIIGSISYIFMGCYLASVYYDEGNILTTITVHALSNTVSVILLLFFV